MKDDSLVIGSAMYEIFKRWNILQGDQNHEIKFSAVDDINHWVKEYSQSQLAALQEENGKLREAGWISIKDALPEEGDSALVYMCKFGKAEGPGSHYIGYLEGDKWTIITSDGVQKDADNNPDYWWVTHWQPLISPSKF